MTHVYTGDGSSLITLGLSARALGAGWRVHFVRFSENSMSTEDLSIFMKGERFSYLVFRETPSMDKLRKLLLSVREGTEIDLLVLEGILDLTELSDQDLAQLIEEKPSSLELVLTGTGHRIFLAEKVDLASRILEREVQAGKGGNP